MLVRLTIFEVPTFLSANAATGFKVTLSELKAPVSVSEFVAIAAAIKPSYSRFATVNVPPTVSSFSLTVKVPLAKDTE